MESLARLERSLIRVGTGLTVIHALSTVLSLFGGTSVRSTTVIVFAVLFLMGVLGCLFAFVVALNRSRHEEVHLAGAFFLAGDVVDSRTRRILYLLLLIQVMVGVGGASLAPFTPVAFSVLVPLVGMALVALTGSLAGTFNEKHDNRT